MGVHRRASAPSSFGADELCSAASRAPYKTTKYDFSLHPLRVVAAGTFWQDLFALVPKARAGRCEFHAVYGTHLSAVVVTRIRHRPVYASYLPEIEKWFTIVRAYRALGLWEFDFEFPAGWRVKAISIQTTWEKISPYANTSSQVSGGRFCSGERPNEIRRDKFFLDFP